MPESPSDRTPSSGGRELAARPPEGCEEAAARYDRLERIAAAALGLPASAVEVNGSGLVLADPGMGADVDPELLAALTLTIDELANPVSRSEEKLRASEQSYRSLWDSLTDLVLILDLEGRFLTVNDAVVERYGYRYEDIVGNTPAMLAAPGLVDLTATALSIEKAVRGEAQRFEFWARTRAGEVFPKEVVLTRGEYFGAPVVIAVGRDVSEHTAAELALRESEERFRSVVESLAEGLLITDAEERVVYANPRLMEIFGYAPEELTGRVASEVLIPPEDREAFRTRMEARTIGTSVAYEVPQVRKDGTRIITVVHGSPLFNAAGELVGSVEAITDVTERKRAERERESAEAHYRRLVMRAPHGIFVVDAAGLLTEVNPAGAEILDRQPEELLGVHFREVVADQGAERAAEVIRRLLDGESEHFQMEMYVSRPSGERRLVELIVTGIEESGSIIGVHGTARDLTEERRKERHLRRVERLASVGTLIGGVAHELNNPLHAIRNFAELLLLENQRAEDAEALEIIRRESNRAAKLVSDLRLFARDTQESENERVAVELNEIVEHVLKVRRYSLETGNVEVVRELSPEVPAVLATRGEIEQVLINLIVNAEQAMDGCPGVRRLTVRTRPTATGAEVMVTDSGRGIPTRVQERIFDPFFTTKAPGDGTGVGLSLVHSIVAEHGGTIHVESRPGAGATFRVHLPAAAVPASDPAAPDARVGPAVPESVRPHPEGGPPRSLRVLVVDDEHPIRRVAVRFLGRLGHDVESAADGGEALRLIGRGDYDVILSDLRMPGIGGEELFRRLRDAGQGMERRVVFMTGDAASIGAARVLADSNVPVLIKPVPLEDLGRAVREMGDAHPRV